MKKEKHQYISDIRSEALVRRLGIFLCPLAKNRLWIKGILFSAASLLISCINDSNPIGPGLIGQWKDTTTYVFTLRDSLYKAKLQEYEDSLGITPNPLLPIPDSLRIGFEKKYGCDSLDCNRILWKKESYLVFGPDSIKIIIYKNSAPSELYEEKYRNDADSIYECCNARMEYVASKYALSSKGNVLKRFYVAPIIYKRNNDPIE